MNCLPLPLLFPPRRRSPSLASSLPFSGLLAPSHPHLSCQQWLDSVGGYCSAVMWRPLLFSAVTWRLGIVEGSGH